MAARLVWDQVHAGSIPAIPTVTYHRRGGRTVTPVKEFESPRHPTLDYSSGQRETAVNRLALPSVVRIHHPAHERGATGLADMVCKTMIPGSTPGIASTPSWSNGHDSRLRICGSRFDS